MSNPPNNTQQSARRGNGHVLGAGLTLAVSVGLFAYGGLWLDARFGTKPWLLLLCVVCGIVGGILHLIRVLAPEMWPFGKLPPRGGSNGSVPPGP
jgi:ATP synthase protein I